MIERYLYNYGCKDRIEKYVLLNSYNDLKSIEYYTNYIFIK